MISSTPHLDDTRAAILMAARRRFDRFGPQKTSMNEVAREAGIARATLYLYFHGKKDLYAALLEQEAARFLEGVQLVAASAGPAPVKLRSIVEQTRRTYAHNPVLLGALTGDPDMALADIAGVVMARHQIQVTQLLEEVLAQGVAEGSLRPIDPAAVAYLMYQLGNLLVVREVTGQGDFDFDRILTTMDDVVARGIMASRGV